MSDDAMKKLQIDPKDYDFTSALPKEMTKEMYVRCARKIFAALRHDLYVKI